MLLLRRGWRESLTWVNTMLRTGGFVLMVTAMCLLMDLHFTSSDLPAGPGGVLGSGLAAAGLPVLNWVGLTICALAVLAIGTQAGLGYSWLTIAEYTGRGVHLAASALLNTAGPAARAVGAAWRRVSRSRHAAAGRDADGAHQGCHRHPDAA